MRKNYCKDCGKEIDYRSKRCNSCANKGEKNAMFGKIPSDEHKQKLSESMMGKYVGKDNPMFGKKQSEKSKQKISNSLKDQNVGENNPNWQGGISCEPYCQAWSDKEFKQDIRSRDDNIAWDIGYWYKGGLSINHINYNKKDCRPKNLITVSRGMNSAINNHKEFYTEWFQIAMSHRLGYSYE